MELKEYFNYFFGKGDTPEFENFTLPHFLPIIIMFVIIALIYLLRDRIRDAKCEKNIRLGLSMVMIICEMSYFWRLVGVPSLNPNPVDHLPITICGWGLIFASYVLTTKNQTLFDICYFWLMAGTVFALMTPTVIRYTGPTRFRFYQFWLEHTLGYISIFYMIFVHKMKINFKSFIKSYLVLFVLAFVAYIANTTLGGEANYLFMATTEEGSPLLDMLPKNYVLRMACMAGVVSVLFFVAYIPWIGKKVRKIELVEEYVS